MALQSRNNRTKQNTGSASGRNKRDKRQGMAFYDLRGQKGYGADPVKETPDYERPYRERHRVEVQPGEVRVTTQERSGRPSYGPEADLFVSSRGTGARGAGAGRNLRDDRSRGPYDTSAARRTETGRNSWQTGSAERGRQEPDPPRRVVHGNAPRGYRGVEPGTRSQTPAADLFGPGNTSAGQNRRPRTRQEALENARRTVPGRQPRDQRSAGRQNRTPRGTASSFYMPGDLRPSDRNRADRGGAYRSPYSEARQSTRPYSPGSETPVGADPIRNRTMDDSPGEGLSRRQRLAQQRREREKQLRRTYLTIGGAAVAAILVLILVIRISVGILNKNKTTEEPASVVAEAGEGDQAGTSSDPGAGEEEEKTENPGSDVPEGESPAEAQENTDQQENGDPASLQSGEAPGEDGKTGEGAEDPADPGREANPGTGEAAPQEAEAEEEQEIRAEDQPADDAGTAAAVTDAPSDSRTYASQDDWRLILVNPWHHLPEGYTIETSTLPNGESVDSRCFQALTDMLEDCRTAGGTPIVCSSYRPHEKQIQLYEAQVQSHLDSGMDRDQAEKEAGTVVAVPGTSEHELGLAVDICDSENQLLDESQADTPTQKWLMENCWYYGFILRYPVDKSQITGIIYEPWHYRYVGTEAAAEIHERGICLEEYLTQN